jgi:phosphatidylglycerol---prolipoprotein diacylglyceryl transferase
MYPTISDLILDLTGIDIPLPIQSFGFMLAISFLFAAWTLHLELKRKESLGIVKPFTVKIIKGAPASSTELVTSFLLGFLLGFKMLFIILNYSEFVNDTQGVLLSAKGNILGGLAVGSIMAYMRYREGEKNRLPEIQESEELMHPYQLVGNLTMVAMVSGIVGAKIFHNLENLQDFETHPFEALVSFSGLTMYGGLIFGTIAVMWYGRKHGIKPLVLADATSPGLMLAYGTGRLGCQIAGDGDWGIINMNPKPDWLSWVPDWAWAYNYPNNVINEGMPIPGCEGRHCMMLPDAVYPTPLYEAIACILLFFVIWRFRKNFNVAGKVFAFYLLLNGIERMFIEQIRVNNKFDLLGLIVTQAEVIAAILILLGISGLVFLKNKREIISEG